MIEPLRETVATALVCGLVPLCLVWVAVTDWHERRIANRASLTLLIGFGAYALALGMAPGAVALAMLCGLAAFLFGFLLFALGQMGAGDVKLLGALAPWLGTAPMLGRFAILLALAGGALSLAMLALRALRRTGPVAATATARGAGGSRTFSAPGTLPAPGERPGVPLAASALVPPLLALGALVAALGGAVPHDALGALVIHLPAPMRPAAALLATILAAALLLTLLFVALERASLAPPLCVPDPDAEAPPFAPDRIETPYGIAIAAAAMLVLPALPALPALFAG